MPYYPDTSVLGAGALTGGLAGASVLSFSGPAVSQSVDTATGIGTVYSSGGANVQNNASQVGFATYLNFDGSALGNVAIANNTATITVNAGAAGATFPVFQTSTLVNASIAALNFIGLTGTITVASSTASIGLSAGGASAPSSSLSGGLVFLSGSPSAFKTIPNSGVYYDEAINALEITGTSASLHLYTLTGTQVINPASINPNEIVIFGRTKASRSLLNIKGPSGVEYPLQPMVGTNRIWWIQGMPNLATLNYVGIQSGTVTGSLTAGTPASTNFSSSLIRTEYRAPTPAAGITAGWAAAQNAWWIGSIAGAGGFFNIFRLIYSNTGSSATSRFFCGYMTGTTFQNVEITGNVNYIGIAKNSTDTTYRFAHCDGNNANRVSIDSGITCNIGDVLEIRIFAKPSATQVNMSLEVISVGGSGTVGAGPYAEYATSGNLTAVPANTLFMAPRVYVQQASTNAGPKFAIISMYGESDT